MAIGAASVVGIYMTYLEEKKTHAWTNMPYKNQYMVYRRDDPWIEKLRAEWYEKGAPEMTTTKGIQNSR